MENNNEQNDIFLNQLNYEYVEIENLASIDILHKRIASGLYHCLGIKQQESQKLFITSEERESVEMKYKQIKYFNFELYGWGSNKNQVLGTNKTKNQLQFRQSQYGIFNSESQDSDSEISNGQFQDQLPSQYNKQQNNDDSNDNDYDDDQSQSSSVSEAESQKYQVKDQKVNFQNQLTTEQFETLGDDTENENRMPKKIKIFQTQQNGTIINYMPLSVACGVYHSVVLAIPEKDIINFHKKILQDKDGDIKLQVEWKQLYSKCKIFTNGLVNNKRLGYYVACQNCKGKKELQNGIYENKGFFCDICKKRYGENNTCMRCQCEICCFDVCQNCFQDNPNIFCQVCRKKEPLIEKRNPYYKRDQKLKKCLLCNTFKCECKDCNDSSINNQYTQTKYCHTQECESTIQNIVKNKKDYWIQIKDKVKDKEKDKEYKQYICQDQQCFDKHNLFQDPYFKVYEKDIYQQLCSQCQNCQDSIIEEYRQSEFYLQQTRTQNICSYYNEQLRYHCDMCGHRFSNKEKGGECLLCNDYFLCDLCFIDGTNIKCVKESCQGNKLQLIKQLYYGGYVKIKSYNSIGYKQCGLAQKEQNECNTNYMYCDCFKFAYKICMDTCYNQAWNQMYYEKIEDENEEESDNENLNEQQKKIKEQVKEKQNREKIIKNNFLQKYHGFQKPVLDDQGLNNRKKGLDLDKNFPNNIEFEDEDNIYFQKSLKFEFSHLNNKKKLKIKPGIVQISCGDAYTLALTTDGQVYGWGQGTGGALGNGQYLDQAIPTHTQFPKNILIKQISAGSNHAAAITTTGNLYCWGEGNVGQLGVGQYVQTLNIPQLIENGIQGRYISNVSCGGYHTAAITEDGYAYSWGLNTNGQLGQGDYKNRQQPQQIAKLENYFVTQVTCGINDTFIITNNGQNFAFGNNNNNKLGIKDLNLRKQQNFFLPCKLDDQYIKGFQNQNDFIYQFCSGKHVTLALLDSGILITWGLNIQGVLARRQDNFDEMDQYSDDENNDTQNLLNQDESENLLKQNDEKKDVKKNIAQMDPGPILKFTKDQFGKLMTEKEYIYFSGVLDSDWIEQAKQNSISKGIKSAKCGLYHTMALTNAGEVIIWGSNKLGQHGIPQKDLLAKLSNLKETQKLSLDVQELPIETLPTQIDIFNVTDNKIITHIECGYEYCFAVENRRAIYAWGKNSEGQLGIGVISEFCSFPTQIKTMEGQLIKQVSCGESHSMILTDKGEVFTCGSPAEGKLGVGPRQALQITPQKIDKLSHIEVISIACGQSHSIALGNDPDDLDQGKRGSKQINSQSKQVIYTWGSGWDSKLGHGSNENIWEPKQLQTSYNFKKIYAGSRHSAAIDEDQQMVIWGPYQCFGIPNPDEDKKKKKKKLAEQQQYDFPKPVLHPYFDRNYIKFLSLSLGDKFSMGISVSQDIYYWGEFDQIIQTMQTDLTTIRDYKDAPAFQKIECSRNHAVALSKNEIYSWGIDNNTGRLGFGYSYYDKIQEELALYAENDQNQKKTEHTNLNKYINQPTKLLYINDYLHEQYMIFRKKMNKKHQAQQIQIENEENQEILETEEYLTLNTSDQSNPLQLKSKMNSIQDQVQENTDENGNLMDRDLVKKQNTISKKQQLIDRINKRIDNKITFYEELQNSEDGEPNLFNAISSEEFKVFDDEMLKYLQARVQQKLQEVQQFYSQFKQYSLYFENFKKDTESIILKKITSNPFKITYTNYYANQNINKLDYQNDPVLKPYIALQNPYIFLLSNFQLHPCYLFNIYKVVKVNKQEDIFFKILEEIFCQLEESERKQTLFIELSKKILIYDIQDKLRKGKRDKYKFTFSLDKNDPDNISYFFVKLFNHLYNQLTPALIVNTELRNSVEKMMDRIYTNNQPKAVKQISIVYKQELCQNYFKSKQISSDDAKKKFMEDRIESLILILKQFLQDIKNIVTECKNNKQSKTPFDLPNKLADLVTEVGSIVKKYIIDINESWLDNQLLVLCLTSFLQSYQKYNQSMLSYQKNEKDKDKLEKLKTMLNNYESFFDVFRKYCMGIQFRIEQHSYIQKLNDFIKSSDVDRRNLFLILTKQDDLRQKQQAIFTGSDMIYDIYVHSTKLTDDKISMSIGSLVYLTTLIYENRHNTHLCAITPTDDDIITFFLVQLKKQISDGQQTYKDDLEIFQAQYHRKINVKLITRQLYHEENQSITKCQKCQCYLHANYLNTDSLPLLQKFQFLNPHSLENLFLKVIHLMDSIMWDGLTRGKYDIIEDFVEPKIEDYQKIKSWNEIKELKDFQNVFNSYVQVKIQELKDTKELVLEPQLRIQIIKELKQNLEKRKAHILNYTYNLEKTLITLEQILKFFKKQQRGDTHRHQRSHHNHKVLSITDKKKQLEQIKHNCFIGLANKDDVEQYVENIPGNQLSKILQSLNETKMSLDIYKYIEQFDQDFENNQKLNKTAMIQSTFDKSYQPKKKEMPQFDINLFGCYPFLSLKRVDCLQSVQTELLDEIKALVQTEKQKYTKSQLEDRLYYIFKQLQNGDIKGTLIYKESQVNPIQILTCNLIKSKPPKEFTLEQFIIPRDDLLEMRKQMIIQNTKQNQIQYGQSIFLVHGLCKLLKKLENQYLIYQYTYLIITQKRERQFKQKQKEIKKKEKKQLELKQQLEEKKKKKEQKLLEKKKKKEQKKKKP